MFCEPSASLCLPLLFRIIILRYLRPASSTLLTREYFLEILTQPRDSQQFQTAHQSSKQQMAEMKSREQRLSVCDQGLRAIQTTYLLPDLDNDPETLSISWGKHYCHRHRLLGAINRPIRPGERQKQDDENSMIWIGFAKTGQIQIWYKYNSTSNEETK